MDIGQAKPTLTSLAHGGGCGCKLAPSVLQDILAGMPARGLFPDLLVGSETADDAAVYRLNDTTALVATTDFFMPMVDDPYEFGRIAATNALSDVYAMGGRPLLALAILGIPIGKVPVEDVRQILAGGASVCADAGIPIAGGHSIDSLEPIYGLVALGTVDPGRILRNTGARPGDALILTKGLGVGILSAALKQGALDAEGYRAMIAATTRINKVGADLPGMPAVHSCTDVTGFGLLGHALEMARGAGLRARLRLADVPVLDRAAELAEAGFRHGSVGPQLEQLCRGRGAADRPARVAAWPAVRPADERRAADRGGAGGRGRAAAPRAGGGICAGGGDRGDGGGGAGAGGGVAGAVSGLSSRSCRSAGR